MNYDSTKWTDTTKKIYNGVLLYSLVGLFYPFFKAINSVTSSTSNLMSLVGGGDEVDDISDGAQAFVYILLAAIIFGYILYITGLGSFAQMLEEPEKSSVGKVRSGAIVMIVATLAEMFIWSWIASIIYLVGFIIMMVGFSGMKKSGTFPRQAISGASTLFTSMILLIIGFIVGLIPFVGGFVEGILCLIAFIMNISGWAKIKNAGKEIKFRGENERYELQ
jgi:hypothetical protein